MKNLTVRYSITQFTYWVIYTGATGFAATYLLDKGLPSGSIGTLLALAGILACLTQPLLAAAADRSKKNMLPPLILTMLLLCCLCFGFQLLPGLPPIACGILYVLGIWSADTFVPLLNALSVACNNAGHPTDFCAARGIGGIGSATAGLALGFIIAQFGNIWMFLFLILFCVICMVSITGYPKLQKGSVAVQTHDESCTVFQFFLRYKWYCVSLLGIAFLGMYHAMTESYLIAIVEPLGGNSSHVGTALFLSAISASPVIFFFSHIRKRIPDTWLLKISGLSFLLQAVLFYFAPSATAVCLLQFMQVTSYAFLGPTQVYYADAKVRPADMVKGQAFVTAAYSLGCSCGNFAGGQLLAFGVDVMLIAGIVMALVGTVLLFLTVKKKDFHTS